MNAETQGPPPRSILQYQGQGTEVQLDVRLYRAGVGNAGAVTSLNEDFTALYVPGMRAH